MRGQNVVILPPLYDPFIRVDHSQQEVNPIPQSGGYLKVRFDALPRSRSQP